MLQSRFVAVLSTGLALLALCAAFAARPRSTAPKRKSGDGFVATKPDSKTAAQDKESASAAEDADTKKKVVKTDKEWMKILSKEQFRITRKMGTERPYTGILWKNNKDGIYTCVCCGQP